MNTELSDGRDKQMSAKEEQVKALLAAEMRAEGLVGNEDGVLTVQDGGKFMVELTVLDITEDEK